LKPRPRNFSAVFLRSYVCICSLFNLTTLTVLAAVPQMSKNWMDYWTMVWKCVEGNDLDWLWSIFESLSREWQKLQVNSV